MRWGLLLLLPGCASEPSMASRVAQGMREHQARVWGPDLILGCDPADAGVWVDDVARGTCLDYSGSPRGLALGQGMHKVEVKKVGFWPYQTYVDSGGTRAALTVKLLPKETRT